MRRLLPALALCAAVAGAGCEEDVPPFEALVVDRCDRAASPDGSWASGPWPGQIDAPETEGLIEIEPQAGVRLLHGLARSPVDVHCYVGFSEDPRRVMPAAGNACEVHEVSLDDATGCHSVVVRNGSGGSFFYRFVLR